MKRYKDFVSHCLKDAEGYLKQEQFYEARKSLGDAYGYCFVLEEESDIDRSAY